MNSEEEEEEKKKRSMLDFYYSYYTFGYYLTVVNENAKIYRSER